MSDKAILGGPDGHTIIPADDLLEWGRWFEGAKEARRVDRTQVGDADVSTVFLGLNHSWGDGPPLWFETMIFGGEEDQYQERYATWDEAVAGHARAVERVKALAAGPTGGRS